LSNERNIHGDMRVLTYACKYERVHTHPHTNTHTGTRTTVSKSYSSSSHPSLNAQSNLSRWNSARLCPSLAFTLHAVWGAALLRERVSITPWFRGSASLGFPRTKKQPSPLSRSIKTAAVITPLSSFSLRKKKIAIEESNVNGSLVVGWTSSLISVQEGSLDHTYLHQLSVSVMH
jgi:transposase